MQRNVFTNFHSFFITETFRFHNIFLKYAWVFELVISASENFRLMSTIYYETEMLHWNEKHMDRYYSFTITVYELIFHLSPDLAIVWLTDKQ